LGGIKEKLTPEGGWKEKENSLNWIIFVET